MTGVLGALLLASFHIIAYHDVDPEPRSGWAMRTEMFVDQMELLAATEQNVVPLADVDDYLTGRCDNLPPRAVVLTVDDGYACAYSEIAPELRRRGFPFSLFIYPSLIGSGEHSLTWAQVDEMRRAGADVESHTMTHPHLMRRSHPEMSDAVYATWLHDELGRARSVVEARTKQPVRFLAYPYGDYDAAVEREATGDGYELALTSESGPNTRTTDPLTLRRFAPDAATTIEAFAAAIGLGKLQLTGVAPADGVAAPAFSATIADHAQFDHVHVVLLGDTRTHGTYDPRSGRVSLALPAHPKPRQRVVVWADDAATGQRFAAIETLYASLAERDRYRTIREKLAALPLHHAAAK
ncbi:MAG TPA: polysaccharide deacetylase family protein [Thermoanaerobaculia bacterium]|nr:polysaccharide deacetylase family protein [Thermoanaerobaculia bacterium]